MPEISKRVVVSGKRLTRSTSFGAIPDGKPFHTFPGIALPPRLLRGGCHVGQHLLGDFHTGGLAA
ncbi:MAG: hypothetical protein J0I79_03605, partial [Mesorhizobium sp.]|nr:hypothetical protein [Mesorhizobium sp.]